MIKRKAIRWQADVCSKLFIILLFSVGSASAIGAPSTATPSTEWLNQWDVPRVIITLLLSVCAFFLIRTLNKFDRNQENIFERLRKAEAEIASVQAVCKDRKCQD